MKQTRQAVHAVKQSILLRCLWFASIFFIQNTNNVKKQINLSLDAKKQLNSYYAEASSLVLIETYAQKGILY